MPDQEVPQVPMGTNEPPVAGAAYSSGRCHWCGYQLKGLPALGKCPECGTDYTAQSAARLQPWPSAFTICFRLGWPIAGLILAGLIPFAGIIFGYALLVAVPINSYYQVRSMLRISLPEQTRTKGPVAILRGIGTTICVLLLLLFVVAPVGFGVACMIMLAE